MNTSISHTSRYKNTFLCTYALFLIRHNADLYVKPKVSSFPLPLMIFNEKGKRTKLWQLEYIWKFERLPSPENSDSMCLEADILCVCACV